MAVRANSVLIKSLNRYQRLLSRINSGECILLDGATGTEMERRGVPQLENAWNGGGALSHPEILRDVHEDYLRLGVDVIISNNFATHYHALADAGEAQLFEAYNRRGVELATEARERQGRVGTVVAAGISYWSWSGNHPSLTDLCCAAEQQVQVLADAGADLLMLEMMIDIDRMQVLLDAAATTELPVWIGLTTSVDDQGRVYLRNGEPLADALAAIDDRSFDLINIMHTEVEEIDRSLDALWSCWSGPVGVYAHSGRFHNNHLDFNSTISPQAYAEAAMRWVERGVRVIGGCCGIEPRHIAHLADRIRISSRDDSA